MTYQLLYSEQAARELSKLDKGIARLIVAWLRKNVRDCENPRIHGKALGHNLSGLWRYRIGDYRVICEIRDNELVVLALSVGHRREIYKRINR